MAMNRTQFQHGMSLFEHFQPFGTEARCEAALELPRWPDGFRCPNCGGAAHCVLRGSTRKTFQCNACHHQTSLIAGTLFEGTNRGWPSGSWRSISSARPRPGSRPWS